MTSSSDKETKNPGADFSLGETHKSLPMVALLRFDANMERITDVISYVDKIPGDIRGKVQITGTAELKSDFYRMTLVFIHAMFEDLLRNLQGNAGKGWTFNGQSDLQKAIRRIGLESDVFDDLFPTLCDLAKIRNRIVHHVDLDVHQIKLSAPKGFEQKLWMLLFPFTTRIFYQRYCVHIGITNAKLLDHHQEGERLFRTVLEVYNMAKRADTLPPQEMDQLYSDAADLLQSTIAPLKAISYRWPSKKERRQPLWKAMVIHGIAHVIAYPLIVTIKIFRYLKKLV